MTGRDLQSRIDELAKRARSGDAEAGFQLGIIHTDGVLKPREMEQGLKLLDQAAAAGVKGARHYLSYLLASGTGIAADWGKALDIEIALAREGDAHAARQLEMLAAMAGEDFDGEFDALKDILKTPPAPDLPPRHDFSKKPLVALFPGFVTPAEADYLIERSKPHLTPSQVIDHVRGGFAQADYRTSWEMRFLPAFADLVILCINERIARAAELPRENQEVLGVLRYEPGQEYKPHCDFLAPDPTGKNPEVERAGQRVKTFLIYLNEDYEGGETEFPRLGLHVRGPKGSGALFTNVADDGSESPLALHAGLPVERGEKWITTLWIRDKTYCFPLAGG